MITAFIDAEGNEFNRVVASISELEYLVGTEFNGTVVASLLDVTPAETSMDPKEARRLERDSIFTTTLDILNPIWYDSLTEEQQTNLATWRQQWLDYPTSGEEPNAALIEGIF